MDSTQVRISVLVAAALVVVVGFALRTMRDRRAKQRAAIPTAGAPSGTARPGAPAHQGPAGQGTARQYVVRKVRPVPEKLPPRILVAPHEITLVEGDGAAPTWQSAPSEVTVSFKPASTFGVNMPTAVITGPGGKSVRGRVTTDPRPPLGGFDLELEEQMARELLDFIHLAGSYGARIVSKAPVPSSESVQGQRLTRLAR